MARTARTVERQHGRVFPTVLPPEETQVGVAAPAAESSGPVERRPNGTVATAEAARELGRRGARKRASRDASRWGQRLGLGRLVEGFKVEENFAAHIEEGERWYDAQCAAVMRDVGGGTLSPGVASVLRTAAWERVFSSLYFDLATRQHFAWDVLERDEKKEPKRVLPRTDLAIVAARLGDSSRQNLLAAHHLAGAEAQSRPAHAAGQLPPWMMPDDEEKKP